MKESIIWSVRKFINESARMSNRALDDPPCNSQKLFCTSICNFHSCSIDRSRYHAKNVLQRLFRDNNTYIKVPFLYMLRYTFVKTIKFASMQLLYNHAQSYSVENDNGGSKLSHFLLQIMCNKIRTNLMLNGIFLSDPMFITISFR